LNSRQLEDLQEQRIHEHVARELGVSVEVLFDYPYEIEATSLGTVWRVSWDQDVPAGVAAHGVAGTRWFDIRPLYEPEPRED
jgi:hypothetical protein